VLDEADRMIEGGHFKELNYILDFIYSNRHKKSSLKMADIPGLQEGEEKYEA
jgi:hypothetical protein